VGHPGECSSRIAKCQLPISVNRQLALGNGSYFTFTYTGAPVRRILVSVSGEVPP
jgi:hypothetical protein